MLATPVTPCRNWDCLIDLTSIIFPSLAKSTLRWIINVNKQTCAFCWHDASYDYGEKQQQQKTSESASRAIDRRYKVLRWKLYSNPNFSTSKLRDLLLACYFDYAHVPQSRSWCRDSFLNHSRSLVVLPHRSMLLGNRCSLPACKNF